MNIHPAIHMEQLKEEYEASASQLLFQGFYNKFQPGPGLKNEQLQWLLQQVVVLDEQRGKVSVSLVCRRAPSLAVCLFSLESGQTNRL